MGLFSMHLTYRRRTNKKGWEDFPKKLKIMQLQPKEYSLDCELCYPNEIGYVCDSKAVRTVRPKIECKLNFVQNLSCTDFLLQAFLFGKAYDNGAN